MEDDVTCELSKIKQKPLSKSDVLAEVETKESCYNGVTVKMETGNDIDYGVVDGDGDLKDFKYDEFGENETNICLEIKAEPTIKEEQDPCNCHDAGSVLFKQETADTASAYSQSVDEKNALICRPFSQATTLYDDKQSMPTDILMDLKKNNCGM